MHGLLSIIRKSDLTDKIKRNFFQAAAVSILLYGSLLLMRLKLTTIEMINLDILLTTTMLDIYLNKVVIY